MPPKAGKATNKQPEVPGAPKRLNNPSYDAFKPWKCSNLRTLSPEKMHMKPLQLRHMNKVFCVCHVEKSKHVHPGFDPHGTQDMKYTWLQISFTTDVFSLRIFVCQRRIQTSWQVSREFSKDLFGRLLWILEVKHQKKLRIFTMLS